MRWLAVALTLASLDCGNTQPPTKALASTDGGQSLRLAVLQDSYWQGGFDRPLFLAFADGTILYPTKRADGIPTEYAQVTLAPSALDSLFRAWAVESSLAPPDSLFDLAPGVSDQHSLYFVVPADSGLRIVQLRAALRASDTLDTRIPLPLRALFAELLAFHSARARPWVPDSIQVAIWPYEYAPDNPPLVWPKDWPSLSDPRWTQREDKLVEEVRFLRLPFDSVPRLDSLLAARRSKQALGIGGRKWAFDYRWIFPFEDSWRRFRDRMFEG